jgi:uncharacterized RDD family membrane protein YckC
MLIHIKRNAEVFGPYSVEEAREYLSVGRLSLSDFAQMPGTTEWIPLGLVPGVRSAPPPPLLSCDPELTRLASPTAQAASDPSSLPLEEAGSVRYAGFWLRFAAGLIDVIILLPANLLLNHSYWGSLLSGGARPVESQAEQALIAVKLVVIHILYASFLLSCPWQATLGMRACGIEITDEAGDRISFARALGRCFAEYLSACFTLGIGGLMIAWTSKKQGLHDYIARTLVVKI